MTEFMTKDFLLDTDTAKTLYHDYAAKLPIIDYHCHVSPKEIYEDLRFENNHVITDYTKRAKTDASLKGIKTTKNYID